MSIFKPTLLTVIRRISTQSPRVAGPIEKLIEERISKELAPTSLKIINESHMHRHHAPMQGVESTEIHFCVKVVSDKFAGTTMIKRHRLIYGLLANEMKAENGIHALALETKTPAETEKQAKQ
ncbi:BolA domain UV induced protein Uvi31 [Coemansia sp. RSA 1591]|nr:BolA domain UV induced protein Uvi31 [Coemansia sp. RSA 1752]KAJ1751075.1 BolA domain UV induced protein Uvi31 [Coemansia sp. RSA 1591]KAJ1779649.1 BolA domain UV induced protein Uvi31 [Coemansia sp. RSA 1938]KAJ2280797.1 BolA domain UV induced protein Uvi31 [Coemansia sp. RSA 451]KAJ2444974.1 BolA domain UV induced protein Uvi31 [Coemansia sp. RSA 2440]KAJ2727298.1 BolA domain UV induced protein Uvi31 [Coemansia sp. D1744]